MNPVALSVRRPVLVTMFILLFVVIGGSSYLKLSRELIPDVSFPFVTVFTIYPGAGPKEVESQVSEKLEDAISTVSNIERLQSINREGFSFIFIEFKLGTDLEAAASDVKEKVQGVLTDLPDDAKTPVVQKFNPTDYPIVRLAVYSDRPAGELFTIANNQVKDALSQVDGVSDVDLLGGREREIQVHVSRERLRSFGLSIMDVVQAVAAENLDVPGGRIVSGPEEISVRLAAKYADIEQIRRSRILLPSGASILLRDVATVTDGLKEQRDLIQFEGKSAIGLEIRKTSGANTVTAADGILKAVERLKTVLPSDIQIAVVEDTSEYIRDAVRDVITNILVGILLTSLFLYLFLHDIRSTFIVAVVMPVSVVATFTLMYAAGFTLNIVSLMGLGISIGTLVVNSIVVLESIDRHLRMTGDVSEAAIQGTTEVMAAVTASVLTNVVVFTPIAFMKGIIGQFFYEFGLTVVFATVFSLIVAFTLTPMMASKLLRPGLVQRLGPFGRGWERMMASLEESYRTTLAGSLRHRWLTVLLTVLSFAGAIALLGVVGGEFFPEGDEGKITIKVKMPAGTSIVRTEETLREIERVARAEVPEIQTLQYKIGGGIGGVEDGEVFIDIGKLETRKRGIKRIVNDLRPKLGAIPAAEITLQTGEGGPGYGLGDIEIEVTGIEMPKIQALADRLVETMNGIEGLVDVRANYDAGKPEITFTPSRDQMARYGLYTGTIAQVIRASYEGEEVSQYREAGEEYDIRVQLADAERNDPLGVSDLLVPTPVGQIPITQLGELKMTQAESEIRRKDKRRMIIVSANIARGNLTGKVAEIQERIRDWAIEPGYGINFGGQAERQQEEFGYIFEALILAIVLTYMVLCATMESYVHPFTIMLTLPLGLVGTAIALFLGGVTINLMSLMAMVMLVGIVVNNAILILDYTAQLRARGTPIVEALIEASVTRLRPIVMTNLAIGVAIAPQVLPGSGAEFRRAVAVVTMGGVLVSAVYTLYLIPAIYLAFDRITVQGRRERRAMKAKLAEQGGS